MRILVDMDQVLALWVEKILQWYNEDYKTNFTRDDVKEYWATEKILGPQGRDFLRSAMRYPDFYQELDEVPGAVEGMKALLARGHEVIIVTAAPRAAALSFHGKLVWLRKHMPFFNLKNVVVTERKELVQGDILLDDGPHNIEAFEKANRYSRAIIFDCPWNRHMSDATYWRVRDWPDFLRLIDEFDAENEAPVGN